MNILVMNGRCDTKGSNPVVPYHDINGNVDKGKEFIGRVCKTLEDAKLSREMVNSACTDLCLCLNPMNEKELVLVARRWVRVRRVK